MVVFYVLYLYNKNMIDIRGMRICIWKDDQLSIGKKKM
jgi:hypothetical protein